MAHESDKAPAQAAPHPPPRIQPAPETVDLRGDDAAGRLSAPVPVADRVSRGRPSWKMITGGVFLAAALVAVLADGVSVLDRIRRGAVGSTQSCVVPAGYTTALVDDLGAASGMRLVRAGYQLTSTTDGGNDYSFALEVRGEPPTGQLLALLVTARADSTDSLGNSGDALSRLYAVPLEPDGDGCVRAGSPGQDYAGAAGLVKDVHLVSLDRSDVELIQRMGAERGGVLSTQIPSSLVRIARFTVHVSA